MCPASSSRWPGRQLLTLGEPERAAFVFGEALALWRGRPLADAERWEPARIEAARLEEMRLDAEEVRVDACLQSGRVPRGAGRGSVAGAGRRCANGAGRCSPWPSTRRAARARRCARCARRARRWPTELGVDPGRSSSSWSRRSCARSRPHRRRVPGEASAVCPYRGSCRSTSATPTASSGVTSRSPSVCVGCRRRRARRGRSVGLRQVLAGARRRRGRAAARRPPRRRDHARARPMDALTALPALSAPPCSSSTSARRPSRCASTRSSRPGSSTALAEPPARSLVVVAARRPARRRVRVPGVRPARRARAVPARADGRGRPAGGDRGRRVRPACCSNRASSTCSCARSRASRARCRCCRMRCARRGSAVRAAR